METDAGIISLKSISDLNLVKSFISRKQWIKVNHFSYCHYK